MPADCRERAVPLVAPGERAVPQRPHVERAAPADEEVGVRDELGGDRGGEAAGDVQRPRVTGEQTLRDRGRRLVRS